VKPHDASPYAEPRTQLSPMSPARISRTERPSMWTAGPQPPGAVYIWHLEDKVRWLAWVAASPSLFLPARPFHHTPSTGPHPPRPQGLGKSVHEVVMLSVLCSAAFAAAHLNLFAPGPAASPSDGSVPESTPSDSRPNPRGSKSPPQTPTGDSDSGTRGWEVTRPLNLSVGRSVHPRVGRWRAEGKSYLGPLVRAPGIGSAGVVPDPRPAAPGHRPGARPGPQHPPEHVHRSPPLTRHRDL